MQVYQQVFFKLILSHNFAYHSGHKRFKCIYFSNYSSQCKVSEDYEVVRRPCTLHREVTLQICGKGPAGVCGGCGEA